METSNLSSGDLSSFSVLKEKETFSGKSKGTENYSMKEAYLHWTLNDERVYCVQAPMIHVGLKHRLCMEAMGTKTAYKDHSQVRRAMCRDESCSSHHSLGSAIFEMATLPRMLLCPQAQSLLPTHPPSSNQGLSWKDSGSSVTQIKNLQP